MKKNTLVDQVKAAIATFHLEPVLEILEQLDRKHINISSDAATFALYQTVWTALSGLGFTADNLKLVKTTIYRLRRYNNSCPLQVSRLFEMLEKALTLELNLEHFEPLRGNGLELLRKKISSLNTIRGLQRELAFYIEESGKKQDLLEALAALARKFAIAEQSN